jgi:hypothetical protein
MRTNTSAAVTNRNVFGFGQDRVVTSWASSCADAALHHASRHAGKHSSRLYRALKRRGTVAVADVALIARQLRLAITGPQWQPVRQMSPGLVMG